MAGPAAVPPPVIIAPAPSEVSFGRVAGIAPAGTRRVVVRVGGRVLAVRGLSGRRFDFFVSLPSRDSAVRVTAFARGGSSSATVPLVYGLPRAARPRGVRAFEDARLAARVSSLARGFGHSSGIYVQDLSTGAGAAWNARAQFPAASTLKLAIAATVLRAHPGSHVPPHLRRYLWRMIVHSDNESANVLEAAIGGSTSGGSAHVNAFLASLGLRDSEMYGGYARETAARRPIPLGANDAPYYGRGKHTTAYDLATLLRYVYLASEGKGPLARRHRGLFTPGDARYLLWLLAHVRDTPKLSRLTPRYARVLHKGGWLSRARHDAGLVFHPRGVFVAAVMTYRPGGVGASSDVLAGKVAAAALARFRTLRR